MTTTDIRLKCTECEQMIPLDGVWQQWDSERCLCLPCWAAWSQKRREGIAAEAERIANGVSGLGDPKAQPEPHEDGLEPA